MSTKVYTGFRVETTDLVAIRALVEEVRPLVRQQAQNLLDAYMARGKRFTDWLDERRDTVNKGFRNPLVDTQFDLLFIPLDGYSIGICYTEHHEWFETWLAREGVRSWAYWNNTDPDEDVSDEEWSARKRDWDSLGFHVPAMAGFTISVTNPMGPMPERTAVDESL